MPATVLVNNLTVVHRDSDGVSMIFPDVCKTPSPAGPIPLPYPNVALSADTADGSSTVEVDGNPIMLKSSCFSKSVGDEAGSALGVVSNKISGKAYPKMFSFDVKVEGEPVMRFTDIMLQNGGSPTNTPPGTEVQANVLVGDQEGADGLPGAGRVMPVREQEWPRNSWESGEVTDLSWRSDYILAACGDAVWLGVTTKNVSNNSLLTLYALHDDKKLTTAGSVQVLADRIGVIIKDNKARIGWIVVRGPWEKTVKLALYQPSLKGMRRSSNQLVVTGVPDAKETLWDVNETPVFQKTRKGDWVRAGYNHTIGGIYDAEIKDGQFSITRYVEFDPKPAGWTPTSKQLRKWKREIDSVWDKSFKIHRRNCKRGPMCSCPPAHGCCMFPLRIRCEFGRGHETIPITRVTLNKGGNDLGLFGRPPLEKWWTSRNWWERDYGGFFQSARAHEFGHLLGLFDEYLGSLDWENRELGTSRPGQYERDSIMYEGEKLYERHVKAFHGWFVLKTKPFIGESCLLKWK